MKNSRSNPSENGKRQQADISIEIMPLATSCYHIDYGGVHGSDKVHPSDADKTVNVSYLRATLSTFTFSSYWQEVP